MHLNFLKLIIVYFKFTNSLKSLLNDVKALKFFK